MLAAVLDDLAREEPADDLDGLHEDAQPGRRLGPVIADDVFVQRLARPEPEPEASGYIASSVAAPWAIMAGWYRKPGGVTPVPKRRFVVAPKRPSRTTRRRYGPDPGSRVEVIRGHHGGEPRLFGRLTPVQRSVGWNCSNIAANSTRGFHVASFVGSISAFQAVSIRPFGRLSAFQLSASAS